MSIFQSIIDFFKKLIDKISGSNNTTTTTTTLPTTTTTTTAGSSDNPPALHPSVFNTADCKVITSRESGFVNNPDSSRKSLKIILPEKYSGTIARVVCFSGGYQEEIDRTKPNEYGNRQRYYGSEPITSYPNNLWIRWDCNENGVSKDYAYLVKDPQQREG